MPRDRRTIRLNDEEWAELKQLGVEWLRALLRGKALARKRKLVSDKREKELTE